MNKYFEKRPWGNFEQFCKNKVCTVKIIAVNPGEELSLQYHHHRDEFWKIIFGSAKIIINKQVINGKKEDEFFIPQGTKHRIRAEDAAVKILEISFGKFSEEDIVRLKDKYGRD